MNKRPVNLNYLSESNCIHEENHKQSSDSIVYDERNMRWQCFGVAKIRKSMYQQYVDIFHFYSAWNSLQQICLNPNIVLKSLKFNIVLEPVCLFQKNQ